MSAAPYVFKRGAVYWWRRRLPDGTDSRALVQTEISLSTKELHEAKRVAADVTQASERLLPLLRDKMISAEDAKKILVKVALAHSAKLDAVAANEIAYGADIESSRRADIATGWAYRLLAAHGKNARIGEQEVRDMRAAGIDDEIIRQAQQTIVSLRAAGAFPPAEERILDLIEEFGIQPTNGNYQQTQQLYLRAIATALLDTRRRWSGIRHDDDALLQQALLDQASGLLGISLPIVNSPVPAPAPIPAVALPVAAMATEPKQLSGASPIGTSVLRETESGSTGLDIKDEGDDDEDEYEDEEYIGLVDLVIQFGNDKKTEKEWGEKTLKQQISLAHLFVRFVGHDNPLKMRQSHIAQFKSALLKFPKNYGKSPKDLTLTVPEILARAADMPPDRVGLATSTMNRHMTQMGNIANICDAAGFPFVDFGGVAKLRAKKKGSKRDERPRFTTDEVKTIFSLPIWTGCESEAERLLAGTAVIHDSTYWVPLLGASSGARREELCGLFLSEIELFEGFHCVRIEDNAVRTLKSPDAKRRVPIMPELVRLGFLDYVEALQEAGHIYLFPELRAAAASTPMGDVFDNDWQKMRAAALPKAPEEGKVFHSFRHWLNNEMKQAGVAAEIRRDIIGHSNGADVNSGRYADAASLALMSKALDTVALPTSHIEAFPIKLSNMVVEHLPRPRRMRRKT
jgi:integrase